MQNTLKCPDCGTEILISGSDYSANERNIDDKTKLEEIINEDSELNLSEELPPKTTLQSVLYFSGIIFLVSGIIGAFVIFANSKPNDKGIDPYVLLYAALSVFAGVYNWAIAFGLAKVLTLLETKNN